MKYVLILWMVSCLYLWPWDLLPANETLESFPVGNLVQTEGRVEVQRSGSGVWAKVSTGEMFFAEDRLRTGPSGWAALVMADESIIQMNKNSLLIFKAVGPRAGWIDWIQKRVVPSPELSEYILQRGKIWLRNKNINQLIDIHAPYVSTSIRGTELVIDAREGAMTTVSVLEGRVRVGNFFGNETIGAFEQVSALPGRPLEKQILLTPGNAVQWTISFGPAAQVLSQFVVTSDKNRDAWRLLFSGNPKAAGLIFKGRDSREGMIGLSAAYILLREYEEAAKVLNRIQNRWPEDLPSTQLKAMLGLIVNHIETARQAAEKAVFLSPANSICHVLDAWVKQAEFDLSGALEATQRALYLDPNDILALLNLARLKFNSGFLEDAQALIEKVLTRSPNQADALNIKGFLMLAMQKDTLAVQAFEAAVRENPSLGEPHLGLCLYHMRQGNENLAQKQITTAVALEPQKSIFLSYWAKMLYEKKRFQQAMDMLEQAMRLDPNDPTPWLYKSHVLRDLNRIHEAIFALQEAMRLNNNQAVYKTRFFLDRDLAVQNINLAQLFKKLGVSEWASVKAVKSMKQDNLNFAAHDFTASQLEYLHGPSSLGARSARMKAFLLKPANANTLSSFNNYTLFFDQPKIEGTIIGAAGNKGYLREALDLNAAMPSWNTTFTVSAEKGKDDGYQTYDSQNYHKVEASLKWNATYKDTLSFQTEHKSLATGDLSGIYDYDVQPDPYTRADKNYKSIRAGYVRKQSPENNLIIFVQRDYKYHKASNTHMAGTGTTQVEMFDFDYIYDYNKYEILDDPFTNVQALQTYKAGDHTISGGLFWYESNRDYRVDETTDTDYYWAGTGVFASNLLTGESLHFIRPRKMQSIYLQDIWNPSGRVTVETAIYLDRIFNVNSQEELTWDETYINPRAGIVFRPTEQDTISLSYKRFLETYESVARIDAIEVAGHVLPSFYEGTLTEEVALSYQHDWSTGVFFAKTFINEPTFPYLTLENHRAVEKEFDQKYLCFEAAVNQLLFRDVGLAAGYMFFNIERDRVTPLFEGENQRYWARLTRLHPCGIGGSIGVSYYDTDYDAPSQPDARFFIVSSYLEYEFPQKKGRFRLEAQNILNRHFNGVPLSDLGNMKPCRTVAAILEFNW